MKSRNPLATSFALVLLLTSMVSARALADSSWDPPKEAEATPSGLKTLVLKAGSGTRHPLATDKVQAHFIGRRMDGSIFMDSHEQKGPPNFDLATVFPGWREGMMLMVEGETRRLWVPPHLGSKKETQTVVFDIELARIVPTLEAPADLLDPPADVMTTPLGAKTRVVEAASGSAHPGPTDAVMVSYIGWTSDGKVFDSTFERGRPTLFLMEKVMPAFADCLSLMVPGERRRCWIAGRIANGNWTGSPRGDLVFDIKLLQIRDASSIVKQNE